MNLVFFIYLNNPVVQFKSATYLLYESTPKAVPIFFSAGGVNASAGVLLNFTTGVYHPNGPFLPHNYLFVCFVVVVVKSKALIH